MISPATRSNSPSHGSTKDTQFRRKISPPASIISGVMSMFGALLFSGLVLLMVCSEAGYVLVLGSWRLAIPFLLRAYE